HRRLRLQSGQPGGPPAERHGRRARRRPVAAGADRDRSGRHRARRQDRDRGDHPEGGHHRGRRPGRPGVGRDPLGPRRRDRRRESGQPGPPTMTRIAPAVSGVAADGDWFEMPVPDNVVFGEGSFLYSSYALLHFRSRHPVGLRLGHRRRFADRRSGAAGSGHGRQPGPHRGPAHMKQRIVVLGMMGAYPFGGQTWLYINWLTSLRALGHEVWYVEDNCVWQYDPDYDGFTDACRYGVEHVSRTLDQIGFGDRWIYRWAMPPEGCWGATLEQLRELYRSCDLLLNVCVATELRDDHLLAPYRVWVETDPVLAELRVAGG